MRGSMKNFLFDLYGTLIDIRTDEQSGEFWEEAARLADAPRADRFRERYAALCKAEAEALPAGGEIDLMRVFRTLLEELSGARCAYLGYVSAYAHAFRAASIRKLRRFEGAGELLRDLRAAGARLYLLSNAQACFTYRELETTGLLHAFDGILLSSEAGYKKPSPLFFRAAFEKFGLVPGECLYVGNDLRDDVGGAHAAGIPCAYLETEQSGRYAEPYTPDFCAETYPALAALLISLA